MCDKNFQLKNLNPADKCWRARPIKGFILTTSLLGKGRVPDERTHEYIF
jgi:hypothetical protein